MPLGYCAGPAMSLTGGEGQRWRRSCFFRFLVHECGHTLDKRHRGAGHLCGGLEGRRIVL